MEKQKVYSIRKFKNGVASVAIATAFFAIGTSQVSAEELQSVNETTVELELNQAELEEELISEEEIIETNAEIVEETTVADASVDEIVVAETKELIEDEMLEKSTELIDGLEIEDENLISNNEELAEDDFVNDEIVVEVLDEDKDLDLKMSDVSYQENLLSYEEQYNQMVLEKRNSIIDISTDKEIYKSGDIIKLRATVKENLFDGDFSVTFYNTKKSEYLYPDFSKFQQIADGTYEAYGEIQLDDIIFDQEYVLGHIADWLGREGPQNLYYIGEEWDSDLTSLGFKIEGLEGVSNTTPELVDLKIEKEYQSDDSIKQINISTVIDSEYELENASFYIRNIDSGNALDYFAVWPDSWKVNSLGQYLGEYKVDAASMYDPSMGSANDKYTLYGFRVEDIHGNYTMLQEKDLNDFFEKFDFEIASEKPKKHYEVELISIKADKEYYLPNEQGELLIELKTENEINGLMSTIFDIDGRADYMTHPYTESDFVKNSAGNYVIKQKFRTPYFLSDASYGLRDIDVFFSAENDWRTYDYNVKVGEEFLEPLFHVRYQKVPKVETKFETRTEKVVFETIYKDNNNLEIGAEKVVTDGIDGIRTIVELVTYVNGAEMNREISSSNITVDPITRVIERGSKGTLVVSETTREPVDFEIEYVDNANLDLGFTQILTPGVKGERIIIEEVTYINGEETSRVETSNEVTQVPTTQIVERGTRVTEVKTETRTEEIPFKIVYKENPELADGKTTILISGVNGTRLILEEVTYVNGVPTERVIMSSEVTEEAIDQIVEIGISAEETLDEKTEQPSQGEKLDTPVTGYSEASVSQAGIAMLPETGEKENLALFTTASLAILAGLGLITSAKRKED